MAAANALDAKSRTNRLMSDQEKRAMASTVIIKINGD